MRSVSYRCGPFNPRAVAANQSVDRVGPGSSGGPLELSHLFAQQARLAFQLRSPLANLLLHFRSGLRLEVRVVQPGQMLAVMRGDFLKLLPGNRERLREIKSIGG